MVFFRGAEKRLKAAKALKEKGETPEELLQSIKDNEAAVAEAQRTVDAWKAIVGEKSRREEAAKAEAERIATEKAEAERKAAEESERAEAEEEARVEAERKAEEERIAKQKAEEKAEEAESDKEEAEKRMDDEEPKPVGSGVFGNIYNQFKGKVKEAFDFLMKHKGGDLLGVFHRKDVGDIDLVWGDENGGLAHILNKHVGEGKSFANVDEAMSHIQNIIETGKNDFEDGDKIVFRKGSELVTVRKNFREGGKKIADKNWVLTAYDKEAADNGNRVTTKVIEGKATPHTASIDKGSEKPEKKQEKQSVFDKAKEIADKEEKKRKAEADKPKQKPLTEAERKDAEEVAGALGYRVEWVDTMAENGTIDADKKVIRIAKDAENPLVQVLGHEVAHGVKRMDGGKFKALQKAAMEVAGEKEWNERIEKKRKLNAYADGKLAEEVTCDIVGEALNDKDALKRLAESLRGEKGILARLRDAVAKMVEYFKNRGDKEGVRRMKAADKLLAEFESALKEGVAPEQVKPKGVDRSVRESGDEPENKRRKDFAERFGVDESYVSDYANGMAQKNTGKAAIARRSMERQIYLADAGKTSKLSDIAKSLKSFRAALKEAFGDLDALIDEYRNLFEEERNMMEAARKKAEEEAAARKRHLDELSLLTDGQIDSRYAEALEKGDETEAREMLDEVARRKGYGDENNEYRMQHRAPSNPGYESDEARRNDIENGPDVNLEDIALGYNRQPDDYFTNPRGYLNDTPHGRESTDAVANALSSIRQGGRDVTVKVYRAVPTTMKEGKLRNGDWVSLSRRYAEMHGNHALNGKYRIMEDEVPAKDIWWDGNDVNEFGYDNGEDYKYKNVKNNRKSDDLVTRDDKGNVIPPSKRFNQRKADERYSRRESKALTAEERELRDNLVERMRKGGLDVVTDSEEMQRVIDTENERTRNMFVGEKGATEADKAEEASTRLDNLSVARRMEEAEKDAKAIKMATGWERGTDGKWRYETSDIKLKPFEEWMNKKNLKLGDIIDSDSGLFEMYPELKDFKVTRGKGKSTNAAIYTGLGKIEINFSKFKPYMSIPSNREKIDGILHRVINHEIQHAIQDSEGFAQGVSPNAFSPDAPIGKLREMEEADGRMVERYNAMSYTEKALGEGVRLKERILENRKEYNALASKYRFGMDGYTRAAGEVEARNTEKRIGMTEEERRASLASETEDVAREDQILLGVDNADGEQRFLRTADGEVYGLVKDGRIYLDPKVATAETAVHEYTHLWGDMLRRKDSEQWSHTVKELKNSVLWEEVKELYPELKTDDEIADEVLSTFSGRRGAERLREEARRVADGDGGVFTKAKAIEALERVKEAIARFWEGVARMFGINRHRSVEELADMAMRDLINGVKPTSRTFTFDNFYKDTKAVFEGTERPKGKPDYISYSGSEYWYGEDKGGKYVVRGSDHWSGEFKVKDGERTNVGRNHYSEITEDGMLPIGAQGSLKFGWKKGLSKPVGSGISAAIDRRGSGDSNNIASCYWYIDNAKEKDNKGFTYGKAYLSEFEDKERRRDIPGDDWRDIQGVEGNARAMRSDEIDRKYPDWLDGTTTDSGRHSTQVEGTRRTYNKVGDWIEKNIGKDAKILDASSGLGYGTADLKKRGFNIEDVEPYQSEERKKNNPATYSSYDDIPKDYDVIISNAVLNVIPDNWRSDVLHNMADHLKPGGIMFINTRKAGEERSIKDKIELDSPQEVLVKRNGKIASYQRFFAPKELKEWVEKELGNGYEVETANDNNSGTKGLAAVVVKKSDADIDRSVREFSPMELSNEDKQRRGDALRKAEPIDVKIKQIVKTKDMSARKAAEKWWKDNVGTSRFYDTEIGLVEINRASVGSSLAHRYSQAKLDAITSLVDGFNNAVYLGSMQDFSRQEGVKNHYFAYPINYNGYRNYVFCRAMQDANKNRLYVHEVFLADNIEKGNTLQTAAFQPHGGITLYKDILANVLTANIGNNSEPSKPRYSRKPGESIFDYASRVSEDVDRSVRERVSARDEYEKKVKSKGFQTKEALQNSMLGLQEFMSAIDHASGNRRYIEDIPDFENPILGENRLSSVNKEEMHQVAKTQFKPLMSAVAKLSGNGKESGELYDYMFAKHGLERDAVMRQREAQKEFDKYQKANPKGTKTIGDFVASLEGKDYAGLTALTAEDGRVKSIQSQIDAIDEQMKATDDQLLLRKLGGQKKRLKVDLLNAARDAADDIRKAFESNPSHDRSDINELWSRVNEVNGNTLRKLYESGMLTKEAYNDISSMYTNYIPMRGFDQTTSADAYAYLTHGDSAFNAPIKTAKGRSSKADNPIAYMQAMAESAIMQGNRNVLVKQKMLNFVRNHPSDLASVSDVWLQYDSVADEWKPFYAFGRESKGVKRQERGDIFVEYQRCKMHGTYSFWGNQPNSSDLIPRAIIIGKATI